MPFFTFPPLRLLRAKYNHRAENGGRSIQCLTRELYYLVVLTERCFLKCQSSLELIEQNAPNSAIGAQFCIFWYTMGLHQ
jgi:hypothetical protein